MKWLFKASLTAVFPIFFIAFSQSCKKATLPKISTSIVSEITTSTAISGGTVTDNGGDDVSVRGVCWATSNNPGLSSSKTTDGTGNGSFVSNLTGLIPNTNYYVRAYATNSQGTAYGNEVAFATGCLAAAASTTVATNVTGTTAILNGSINANGSATTITFEYGLTTSYGSTVTAFQSPLVGNSNTPVSVGISDLTPGSTYHFRIKAVSCGGTVYGNDQIINSPCLSPTATTDAAANLTTSTANLNGTVNARGSITTVTFEYGTTILYGTMVNASPMTVAGNGNTAVSAGIKGLSAGTYHYRIKAVSCGGTIYGSDQTFTISCSAPAAVTNEHSNLAATTVILNGVVNANGSSTTVSFDYGASLSYGSTVTAIPGTVTGSSNTSISARLSGLNTGTTYHYRAKAESCGGIIYGSDRTFILPCFVPVAATKAATNITATGATLNGLVNANGSSTVVIFEYGTTINYGNRIPATQSPVTGINNDPVSLAITGLTANTKYFYRVTATNCGGTTYSTESYFFTIPGLPTYGLISYFKFDDDVKDFLGNTPEGVCHGSVFYVPGKAGHALSLNGTNAYVDFARDNYKSGNNVSVALWFRKSNAAEVIQYFIICSDFGVATRPGQVAFAIWTPLTESAIGNISPNTWVHLVGTYDGINIKLYLNGVLVETTYHPGNISDSNKILTIGNFGGYWSGVIDDLFIYNKVLNQSEINQLFDYH